MHVPCPGLLTSVHTPPMALARSLMFSSPKPMLRHTLRAFFHADAVIDHGELEMIRLFRQFDLHRLRVRMTHGVADGFLRDAQQFVFMLRRQARVDGAAFERADDAARNRRTLRELAERLAQAAAASLFRTQREHRAAR